MDDRESAEMMKSPATKDEDEIQIARGSESPSSSSYARSDSHQITIRSNNLVIERKLVGELRTIACTCCGHHIPLHHQADILNDLPGMPAGVKFDPSDVEILEHLEAKANSNSRKLHPLIDQFIPTLKDDNGICYTHPENLPGVSKDGVIRHFFHRPSKAYTTGSRKRRKVQNNEDDGSGGETRWHKTGKTRAVVFDGGVKGFKKILVLYTNYGRQRKPEKTNWVMHQYHIGQSEEEKDGELVLSKVFYQTQPRHVVVPPQRPMPQSEVGSSSGNGMNLDQYYHHHQQQQLETPLFRHGDGSSSLVSLDGRHKEKELFEGDTRADHK